MALKDDPRNDSLLKIAQIGVGYWGPNLLRNLVANKRCQVIRVVDASPERRSYVNGLYPSVLISADPADIFNDRDIDAVVIATPVATHYDLAIKALTAGKHILVEKPLARRIEEVDHMKKLAEEKTLVAMVGHTFLYNAAVRYVKKLIDSNELGEIQIYLQPAAQSGTYPFRCGCALEFCTARCEHHPVLAWRPRPCFGMQAWDRLRPERNR